MKWIVTAIGVPGVAIIGWAFRNGRTGGPVTFGASMKVQERVESSPKRDANLGEIRDALAKSDRESFTAAFSRLVKADPAAAASLLDNTGPFHEEALRCLAQEWAKLDLETAHAWAAALPGASERENALTLICFAVAEDDPEKAIQIAQADRLGDATGTLRNLTQQWAVRNFTAAGKWAAALPQGPQRDEICGRVAFARAEAEPEEAARWLVEQIPAGPAQDEAVMSVLNRWLRRDPKAASEWIGAFPDNDLKARAELEVRNATGG